MKILITGGASGLGEAITRYFAKDEGNQVYFTYCKSADKAGLLRKEFGNTHALRCDFADTEMLNALCGQIGQINPDLLINNAIPQLVINHFHKEAPETLLNGFSQNVMPVIKLTQKCLLGFRKQKSGRIINILSAVLSSKPLIGWSQYTAEKSYLHAMSNSWAVENAAFNITSNCISPSFMLTELNSVTDERVVEEIRLRSPLKRLLTVEEVAECAGFLATCTPHLNGVNLVLNG
ncbi:MAG: SDR family NAD(P)-dependent oxidoreductase [Bacteroidia bacterium]